MDNTDFQELVKVRRALHLIPEIGLQQYETSKFVRNYLSNVKNVQILDPIPSVSTAVIALINVQQAKEKYLFRCELDALPWQEKSNEEFASKNGLHHACGHDAHMAMMLVACKKIAEKKQLLTRSILFCFQPGEEGKGGAKKLIQSYPQVLESVTYAFAIHSGNHLEAGYIAASSGVISANSQRFHIDIKGKACHVMIPESGVDANFIACHLVTQLYALKQTKLNPVEQGLLCVTKVEGGEGLAIISQKCKIVGSLRMLSTKGQEKMRQEIKNLATNYCTMFGAQCELTFNPSHYRSVYNDPKPTKIVQEVIKNIFNEKHIKQQIPSFNGQDFCEFSERVPSCYFILGAAIPNSFNENHESNFPIHSNRHRLDERFMQYGLKVWVGLAFSKNE